jgi:hypothetical protein
MEALQNGDFDLSHNEIIEKVYNRDDRLNALKFGKRTKQLYPDIQQIQDYAPESRLSRGVVQEMEERIRLHAINPADPRALDPKDKRVVAIMHHIACAGRNLGPFNMNNLQDQPGTAFGSEPLPVLERARVHLYKPGGPLHPAATAEAA